MNEYTLPVTGTAPNQVASRESHNDAINATIDAARDFAAARANHSGTQDMETVSGLLSALDELRLMIVSNASEEVVDDVLARVQDALSAAMQAESARDAAFAGADVFETVQDGLDAQLTSWCADGDDLVAFLNDVEKARLSEGGLDVLGENVFTPSNIIGTVSQSGGEPTGAIIQRGSGPNGRFVRFADGTQICWRDVSHDFNTTAVQNWDLPASFVNGKWFAGWTLHRVLDESVDPVYDGRFGVLLQTEGSTQRWRTRNPVQTTDIAEEITLFAAGPWYLP